MTSCFGSLPTCTTSSFLPPSITPCSLFPLMRSPCSTSSPPRSTFPFRNPSVLALAGVRNGITRVCVEVASCPASSARLGLAQSFVERNDLSGRPDDAVCSRPFALNQRSTFWARKRWLAGLVLLVSCLGVACWFLRRSQPG